MNYKFLNSSQKAWTAMFEGISSARKSIYLEMYIFREDMIDFDFLKLLKEKAKSGLDVKIILDSVGSGAISKKTILELREAGIELFFLSYFMHRTHRKILIVDETIAFVGGVNLHQGASLWDDLVVEIRGRLLPPITRSFAKVYKECGGKDVKLISIISDEKILKDKMRTWVIEHFPVSNKFNLKNIYKENLSKAEVNITLATPYFMPRRWLIGLLHQAVLRGVTVDVLVPKSTDYYLIDRVNYFFIYKLSKLGVNFYFKNNMNHAKLMIIDAREAIVGSNNLDYLSFELNSEVGIFFKDINVIRKLTKIVEEWKKDSTLFDHKIEKPKLFDYILSPVISIFNRIL